MTNGNGLNGLRMAYSGGILPVISVLWTNEISKLLILRTMIKFDMNY